MSGSCIVVCYMMCLVSSSQFCCCCIYNLQSKRYRNEQCQIIVSGAVKEYVKNKRCITAIRQITCTAPVSSASLSSPLFSSTPPGTSKTAHVRLTHTEHVNFLARNMPSGTGSDEGHVQCHCDKLIVITRLMINQSLPRDGIIFNKVR